MASTTKNAIDNDAGVGLAFVLQIEGYKYLITDHDDLAAVTLAYTSSHWSNALPGLIVEAARQEEIEPWSAKIAAPPRTFGVKNLDVYTDSVTVEGTLSDVVWTNKVNTTATGSKLEKTSGVDGVWDAGAQSVASIATDGYVQFQISNPGAKLAVLGFSVTDEGEDFTDTDYGMYIRSNLSPGISVVENGSYKGGTEALGTTTEWFRVRREGTTITYERDDDTGGAEPGAWRVFFTSVVSSSGALIVDTSFSRFTFWFHNVSLFDGTNTFTPGTVDEDRFGRAVHADGNGFETYLTVTRDPDDTTNIQVTDTTTFPSSGVCHIGTEAILYTDTTGTLFQGSLNRGRWTPLQGNVSTNWARTHLLPTIDGTNVQTRLKVTSEPRTWIGKHITLRVHRVVGGVLDTLANSYLLFAGNIASVVDGDDQTTRLSCDDIRKSLASTVLMRDQFVGRVAEGVFLRDGSEFDASSNIAGNDNATPLSVVTGAAGANQMEPGYWKVDTLVSRLNEWLSAETAAARLHSNRWTVAIAPHPDGGYRTEITVESSSSGWFSFGAPGGVLPFLGFNDVSFVGATGAGVVLQSINEPLRIEVHNAQSSQFDLDYSTGTWFDNQAWLPPDIQSGTVSGENWGVIIVGGGTPNVVKWVNDLQFTNGFYSGPLAEQVSERTLGFKKSVSYSESGHIEIKQLVILHGSFKDVLLRVIASTGATGYNHATYDTLPWGLSVALPWDLIGSVMTDSLDALGEATARNAITLYLDKPTSFEEAFGVELLLRAAFLVWKGEGLAFVQLPSPNADTAIHTLAETNKASQAGTIDANRTATETTDAWLRNVIVVKYDRSIVSGEYRSEITVRHESSINRYGERKVEIKARNAYSGTSDVIASLVTDLGSFTLPMFAEPMKILHRSVGLNHFLAMAVGDIAVVSDNYARDPSTGIRGLTTKPALVLGTEHDFGGYKDAGSVDGMFGKVTLAFASLDNTAVFSPAALVDDTATNNGYQADTPTAGKSTWTFYDNTYSNNGSPVDISHFTAGDEASISEMDFTGGGTPLEWTKTIESVDAGAGTVVFDDNFAAFDSAAFYRMTFANYSLTVATQKTKAFQADTDDARVQDVRSPFEYGSQSNRSVAAVDLTILPMRYALSSPRETGDGDALNTGFSYDLAAMSNQLINYKTAVSAPQMWEDGLVGATSATDWTLVTLFPFWTGQALGLPARLVRKIYVAPHWKAGGASGTVSCRITITPTPPRASSVTNITIVGQQQATTFTTTDTTSTGLTATAVGLPVIAGSVGLQWVVVELQGNGTQAATIYGLPVLYLGPLE